MSSKNKLKILHVISQRPDSTGSGIYVQAMIREAAANKYDNFLIAGINSTENRPDIKHLGDNKSIFVNFYNSDISYLIPGMSDIMPYQSTKFSDLSEQEFSEYEIAFSKSLKAAVDKFKPNIIHTHHLWIVSSITRQLFPNIPVVTSCHGSELRQFQNCPHLQERVLKGCQKIDVVMALSKAQKNELVKLYKLSPTQITVTGAGFNTELFYPVPKSAPAPVQIVYAGKLSNAKGVPYLLRALYSIPFPSWHLHLVGNGTGIEKEYCLKLAEELGKNVTVYGAIPQSDLAQIVRNAHILVLPSFFEGLPLVLLEGLAAGCRIITTSLPGANEILGNSSAEFISLIPVPRLHFIDQPYKEDEPLFEQNLRKALLQQITAAYNCREINLSLIQDKLNSYSWIGIFKKVRKVYLKCLNL